MKRFRIFLLLFLTTLSAVANEYDLMIQRLSNTLRETRLPPEKPLCPLRPEEKLRSAPCQ